MRKNKMLAVIAIAMAVMMAATACGSKDNQSTKPDVSTEAGTAETTKGTTDETKSSGETTVSEEDSEGGETATEDAKKAASDAGSISSGVFTSKSGKYQITPPQGWTIEEDGDESAVAFSSPNGSDLLEVTYVEGDEADSAREVYPNTME